MNVGLIHYSYPPVVGGVEFVLQGQARQFARHGHRVRVLSRNRAAAEKNIRCIVLPELQPRKLAKNFGRYQKQLERKLRRLVRGLDLVLVHNIMTMPFNLALTAALWNLAIETRKRTRWIFWTHDLSLLNPDYPTLDTQRFPYSLLKQPHPSARYVAVSELRRQELCRLLKMSRRRVRVIPDGVDVPALLDLDKEIWNFFLKERLHEHDHVLFLPTRILRRKNLEGAVELVAHIQKMRRKIKLLVTGAPDPYNKSSIRYFAGVRARVKKLRLENNVIFLGRRFPVTFGRLLGFYRLCDAVLMTSRQEGFGLPLLEAGAQSKPVICPRRPPFTEVMGKRAIYLTGNNFRAVVRALDRSPTTGHFKRVLRHYSWEAVWQNHLSRLIC
jgi:glycosyltransferase involved in cell wall biosynthesis